jgi:hypothetical protein
LHRTFRTQVPHSALSLAYSSVHDRRPEEPTLGFLNNLLVDRLRRVIHEHRALLVIDLGIDTGIADEIDDPLLAFGLREVEAGGEVPASVHVSFCCCLGLIALRETYLMSIR